MPLDAGQDSTEDAAVELAAAIRAAMLLAGLSQERAEAATGIDQARLSRILNRKSTPTLDNIMRIERACSLPAGYLLAAAGLITLDGARQGARARAARRSRPPSE